MTKMLTFSYRFPGGSRLRRSSVVAKSDADFGEKACVRPGGANAGDLCAPREFRRLFTFHLLP